MNRRLTRRLNAGTYLLGGLAVGLFVLSFWIEPASWLLAGSVAAAALGAALRFFARHRATADHARQYGWMSLLFRNGARQLRATESARNFGAEYDAASKRLTLIAPDKQKNVFQYSQPDAGHVVLEGSLGGANLVVGLRQVDVQKFLLVNRGFHWINERPFNR